MPDAAGASRGAADAPFAPLDWLLLASAALMWGTSYLFIEVGLESLRPGAIAWLRLLLGTATLACIPGARHGIPRADWPWIALLGAVWMAAPFLLFPLGQRSVDSSLAGMINGAAPLFTAAVAALWSRRLPGRRQFAGLATGFLGILAIYGPHLRDAGGTALGAGFILAATMMYGIAYNLAEPLSRRNGALPVVLWSLGAAAVMVAPVGVLGLSASTPDVPGLFAMAALGAGGTGLAVVAFAVLVRRVGAPRASVTNYLIPVVAILVGVSVRGEAVSAVALAGTALVLLGAWLTSRASR